MFQELISEIQDLIDRLLNGNNVSAELLSFGGVTIPNSANALTSDFVVDEKGVSHIGWTDGSKIFYAEYPASAGAPGLAGIPEIVAEDVPGMVGAEEATPEAQRPALALAPDGRIMFAYAQPVSGPAKQVYLKVRANGAFSQPILLGPGWQAAVAVDALNQTHVIAGDGGQLAYHKFDKDMKRLAMQLVAKGAGPSIVALPNGGAVVAYELRAETEPHLAHIEEVRIAPDGKIEETSILTDLKMNALNVSVALDAAHRPAFAYQESAAGSPLMRIKLQLASGRVVVASGADLQCYNPRLVFKGAQPMVVYALHKVLLRRWIVRFSKGNVPQNIDQGDFPGLRVSGDSVYIVYRHTPVPSELRIRLATIS